MEHKGLLIFDFDGTLVDSLPQVIEKLNLLAEKLNFRKVNPHEVDHIKNLSSKELIQYLQIPVYKVPKVLYMGRQQMRDEISTLSPFPGILDILQKLDEAGFLLGILTSNSLENVTSWLESHHIQHIFNFIHSGSNYLGKARFIKKIIKKYKMDAPKIFYVGDETRDVEAAQENAIQAIAVTWGFNSEKILLQHRPQYIARKPLDILQVLKA